jgi:hypothetical protein
MNATRLQLPGRQPEPSVPAVRRKRAEPGRRLSADRQPADVSLAASVAAVLRSPGQPLDPATRRFMEPPLGHDFSRVRTHSDARSAMAAGALDAAAFTVGNDVVFGEGLFAPATPGGPRLLAHELAHVVQQDGPAVTGGRLTLAPEHGASEREADRAAERVVAGQAALPIRERVAGPAVQRSVFGGVLGGVLGAIGGAVLGFVVGGPVGAVVGGLGGLVGGAMLGEKATERQRSLTEAEKTYAQGGLQGHH